MRSPERERADYLLSSNKSGCAAEWCGSDREVLGFTLAFVAAFGALGGFTVLDALARFGSTPTRDGAAKSFEDGVTAGAAVCTDGGAITAAADGLLAVLGVTAECASGVGDAAARARHQNTPAVPTAAMPSKAKMATNAPTLPRERD
jgi:hypothetical protein